MFNGWQVVLAGAAVAFLGYLVFRMRPGQEARAALTAGVRAARERARTATTPRERAQALAEAGTLAIREGARWTAGVGFFLRAMKADPTWPDAVEQAVAALHKRRPRLLEKMLWRRLAHVPWDAEHRPALRAVADGLARVYGDRLRDSSRREVMARLAKSFA